MLTVEDDYANLIEEASSSIKLRTGRTASVGVGIILGSGLSSALPDLEDSIVIPYLDIPGFPKPTVAGHHGTLVFGRHRDRRVAVMQGRFHYYEGHPMSRIGLPVRVLKKLGMDVLVITSAVGSMRKDLKPGDIAFLKDHINFMGDNPLRGVHGKVFGEMFPDLAGAYDPGLRKLGLKIAKGLKMRAVEGVYIAAGGPSYETPAEIRAFRKLGADVVGMSVVPEVITARQMGVRVLAISWIANMASGLTKASLSHPDVLSAGESVSRKLKLFLKILLDRL